MTPPASSAAWASVQTEVSRRSTAFTPSEATMRQQQNGCEGGKPEDPVRERGEHAFSLRAFAVAERRPEMCDASWCSSAFTPRAGPRFFTV
jgi:hypothetical protein